MKYILTILILITCFTASAQYIPNSGAYQYKGIKTLNSLQPPTGTGSPVTGINAPDSGYTALYYNKADTSLYLFNPVAKTWGLFRASGGGGVTIDSVFITSIDSIFITNTDSIFIISGNDTIFIGINDSPRDTAYLTAQYGIKILNDDSTYKPNGQDVAIAIDTSVFHQYIIQIINNDTT